VTTAQKTSSLKSIPRAIWALGFVSLLMDASSELVHSLLPVFMVSVLGASMTSVGIIEGAAEATALVTKIFSGTLSDYLGKRKLLTLIGYGLAAVTKPLFPLAGSMGMVFIARFLDRIGKGIRGAPRDALIGDIAPADIRGACFGLRQSLDTVGAVIGPLLAVVFMGLFADNLRAVLWIAVVPALGAVALLAFAVREPEHHQTAKARPPFRLADIRHAGSAFWELVAIAGLLTLGRFSEAFLVLKAQAIGLPIMLVPLVMVAMSLVYALSAYPAGRLSDNGTGRKTVVQIGIVFLVAADLALAGAQSLWMLGLGVGLWGLHMGFTQGSLATLVADTTPAHMRGTAYGVFNLVSGIAMLLASLIAGLLWDHYGPAATFGAGAAFGLATLAGLFLFARRKKHDDPLEGECP
jgi:MFS family permease